MIPLRVAPAYKRRMKTSNSFGIAAFAAIVTLGAGATGCEVEVGAAAPVAGATVEVYQAPPPLVEVDSGVSVVEESDYPVYYTGGSYWEYRESRWYHAPAWDADWVVVDVGVVPVVIAHRDHSAYVHYHASASAHVWHENDTHTSYQSHGSTGHPSSHGSAPNDNGHAGAPGQPGQSGQPGGSSEHGTPPPGGHDNQGHENTDHGTPPAAGHEANVQTPPAHEGSRTEAKPEERGPSTTRTAAPAPGPKVETPPAARPAEVVKPGTTGPAPAPGPTTKKKPAEAPKTPEEARKPEEPGNR